MNIVVDCRSLRKKPAGVPNFLIEAINQLSGQKKDWKIYLLSNDHFHPDVMARLHLAENLTIIISPLPFLKKIALIWYFFKVPHLTKALKADLFFSPIPNLPPWLPGKVKRLVVVHDMVYKLFPGTMSLSNRLINVLLHDRSVNNAEFIWAVSRYTEEEVIRNFPFRKSKRILVGSAVNKSVFQKNPAFSGEQKKTIAARYGIEGKIILAVGTLEPRKNLSFLISLMPDLVAKGFSLVIVGAAGWGNVKLTHQENIKLVGFVSNEELVALYHAAEIYVSVSLNEGFGLPQLEAMCCGCPVVSAHNSANIEIVSGAGETVKGWDKNEWADVILNVAQNRSSYIASGYQRALEYDWADVGKNLIHYIAPSEQDKQEFSRPI